MFTTQGGGKMIGQVGTQAGNVITTSSTTTSPATAKFVTNQQGVKMIVMQQPGQAGQQHMIIGGQQMGGQTATTQQYTLQLPASMLQQSAGGGTKTITIPASALKGVGMAGFAPGQKIVLAQGETNGLSIIIFIFLFFSIKSQVLHFPREFVSSKRQLHLLQRSQVKLVNLEWLFYRLERQL
jgi:hypothetical protein